MSQQLLTIGEASRKAHQRRVRSDVHGRLQIKRTPAKGKYAMAAPATLRTADPDKLLDHPFSVAIYGQDLDDAFVESIRRRGIEQPIVVAADGKTVVAGHRRRRAAKIVGLKRVPIVVRADLSDDLDIKHAIIETNRQRVKTPEQIGREAEALWQIEQENAALRRNAHLKQTRDAVRPKSDERQDEESDSNPAEGRSDDIVARQLGVGRDTIRKAVYVARAIDAANQSGNAERIAAIRRYSTVNAAYREALKANSPEGGGEVEDAAADLVEHDWTEPPEAKSEEFQVAFSYLGKVARELEVIANAHGDGDSEKHYKSCSVAWDRLCHAIIAWEESQLAAS